MANLRQCDKCGTTEKYVTGVETWKVVRGKDLCPKCDEALDYWLNQPYPQIAEASK